MSKIKFILKTVLIVYSLFTIGSCSEDELNTSVVDNPNFETPDWTTDTHSKDVAPNFGEVFQDNTVKRIDIVISKENWAKMLEDMTQNYGTFGANPGPGGSGGPNPGSGGPDPGSGGPNPGSGGPGGGPGGSSNTTDPIFVPAEVFYNSKEWYRVGVRFKGNSSLRGTWNRGTYKLSFKLDFDEYEDDYPQIKNQRFYGFKKLSLKNNCDDKSMLREKVAIDVFRRAGLVASHTSFYTVYVDYGEGAKYFGVYTMVEEVDDTVIDTQFSSDDGNLYKPDGGAASFAANTYNEEQYVKKNNEDESDFSDVKNLLEIVNDNSRTTNPEQWRTNLEKVFDTDVFLKYLAINTVIQNWDTYGNMTHNYYLYNNPDNGKLTWIPWDYNEALQKGKGRTALTLDFSGLNAAQWPLIGYLYEDEVYKAKYDAYVKEIASDVFSVATMQTIYNSYSTLIEPYAKAEVQGYTFLNNSSEFNTAISELNQQVQERATSVSNYLNK